MSDDLKEHIVASFDRDLEAIQAHIMRMGGLVEQAIQQMARSYDKRDEQLAQEVQRNDIAIDELDALINNEAARLLATRSPTAVDLRVILSVMKISANLERIGDYAKNIAKRTLVLLQMNPVNTAPGAVRRMSREVEVMLKDALDSYIQRDAELAHDVINRDTDVDQIYNALFREFLTYMMEDPRNITPCMHLHFIVKNIERMGDHVTSIAEQVIYLVDGEQPSNQRAKVEAIDLAQAQKLQDINGL